MIADSHCHLDYDILYNELEAVINRASRNNVKLLLTICTTFESFKKIKFIVDKYSNIFGTFGIHPHESKNFINIDSDLIVKHKKTPPNRLEGGGKQNTLFVIRDDYPVMVIPPAAPVIP